MRHARLDKSQAAYKIRIMKFVIVWLSILIAGTLCVSAQTQQNPVVVAPYTLDQIRRMTPAQYQQYVTWYEYQQRKAAGKTRRWVLPRFKAPQVKLPRFKAPKIKTPQVRIPRFKVPQVRSPRPKSPQPQANVPNIPGVQSPKKKAPQARNPVTVPQPKANTPQQVQPPQPRRRRFAMPKLRMPRFKLPGSGHRPQNPSQPQVAETGPVATPQPQITDRRTAPVSGSGNYYVINRNRTKFYTLGPQQPMGPDAYLAAGTLVTLNKSRRGWADIQLADGRVGTIAANTLRAAAPSERPRPVLSVPSRPPVDVSSSDFNDVDTSEPEPEPEPVPVPEDFTPPELPEGIPSDWILGDSSLVPSFTDTVQPDSIETSEIPAPVEPSDDESTSSSEDGSESSKDDPEEVEPEEDGEE